MTAENTTERGVQFGAMDGRRSSQRAGVEILADAVRAVDEQLAREIERTSDWRKRYEQPFEDVVAAGVASSKDALRIAADGLESARRHVTFIEEDNDERTLNDALTGAAASFETEVVEGTGERVTELVVPYKGQPLRGESLRARLAAWERAGVLEPSCRRALELVMDHPEWLDLRDRRVALLGAASEMGPLEPLSSWGATIVAVDLPRPQLWGHILGTVRAGAGRALVPVARSGGALEERAGADLLTELPATRAWLADANGPLTVGNYVYADGSTFLRLAIAVDALVESLLADGVAASLAYLATPTDVFAVPADVFEPARERGRARRPMKGSLRTVSGGRLYSPSYGRVVRGEDGREWAMANALVAIQGPNYALAKSLQRWRAIVAREEGATSSANVAPAARTRSVVKNKLLAAAYRGAPRFGIEIFEPETARFLTAALLVHDLCNPAAAARPEAALAHPFDLFVDGALHGGMWRLAYTAKSVLPLALVRGMLGRS